MGKVNKERARRRRPERMDCTRLGRGEDDMAA